MSKTFSIASEVKTLRLMVSSVPNRSLLRKPNFLMRIRVATEGQWRPNMDRKFGVKLWYTQNVTSNLVLETLEGNEGCGIQQPGLNAIMG